MFILLRGLSFKDPKNFVFLFGKKLDLCIAGRRSIAKDLIVRLNKSKFVIGIAKIVILRFTEW